MKLKANYHTHVKLCNHAIGMSEDYIKEAIKLGYKSIGMSDHGPLDRGIMSKEDFENNWLERHMDYETFKTVYLPDLVETKGKYKDKIKMHFGVEIEYVEKFHDYFVNLRNDLDYMNLGVHFFIDENDKIVNSFSEVTYKNVLSYANKAKKAMESGLYSIIVHPDVFMYDYKNSSGLNEWDENCELASKIIIEASIKNNVYLEINCGGLFKVTAANAKPGEYGYPRRQFWELASKYSDIKVVIGVDAHDPKQLGSKEINDALEFANSLGIKVEDYCDTIEKATKN